MAGLGVELRERAGPDFLLLGVLGFLRGVAVERRCGDRPVIAREMVTIHCLEEDSLTL